MITVLDSPAEVGNNPYILVVEDSDVDFYTFLRILKKLDQEDPEPLPHYLLRFADGDEVLDYLLRRGDYETVVAPYPAAILLDLNLPGTDGRDVIQILKQHADLQVVPIIALSSSRSPQDVFTCYSYGVNSYVGKAMGTLETERVMRMLFHYWFECALLPTSSFP